MIKVNGKETARYRDDRFLRGHIALEQHDPNSVVEFQSVEIREFSVSKPTPKPSARLEPRSSSASPKGVDELLANSKARYDVAIAKAKERLLARFDVELRALRKPGRGTTEQQKLVDAIQLERDAFEKKGFVPWSLQVGIEAGQMILVLVGRPAKQVRLLRVKDQTMARCGLNSSFES